MGKIMDKASDTFAERKKWLKKVFFSIFTFFLILIICAYLIAWIHGADFESIIISGSLVLLTFISFCGGFYILAVKLAKKQLKK